MEGLWVLNILGLTILLCTQINAQNFEQNLVINGEMQSYFTKVLLSVREEGSNQKPSTVNLTLTSNSTKVEEKETTFTLNFGPAEEGLLKITSVSTVMVLKMGDYWTLSTLNATIVGKYNGVDLPSTSERFLAPMLMSAPKKMSFHCSRYGPLYLPKSAGEKTAQEKSAPTFIPSIEFLGLQIQPTIRDHNRKFGTSYDCVGFFSIGILSGIFINIFLMAILAWGLVMIMSVKTMDRFDDPKGKPISIGATD